MIDIKTYLASGVVEAFVFGELNETESKELLRYAQEYNEVQKAVDQAETTLYALGKKGSISLPANSKELLFQKLGLEMKTGGIEDVADKEKPLKNNKPSFLAQPFLLSAASIIAILGIVLSAYFYNQWKETDLRLSQLISQNQSIAQQYDVVKNQLAQYAQNLEILKQPGIETVLMKGLDIAPKAEAMVHWNRKTNQVFLNAKKMPSNEIEKQYQLWAIVDGEPKNMGVFDVAGDMTSILKMKTTSKASAFAVTLEPRGGSKQPSLEKIFVAGQI